jgi:hypothetical protein
MLLQKDGLVVHRREGFPKDSQVICQSSRVESTFVAAGASNRSALEQDAPVTARKKMSGTFFV